MAKELLIRKQKGTHSPQCTSYRIVEPAWRFTLETCDEDVTGVIKDDVGNTIATVSAGAPAIVSRLGLYNVCVTGNGMGALYVEWTSDTYVDQQCCNEVRKEFEQMLDDAIANVESKIPSATVTVRSGENTEVTKSGNTYTVNATDTVTTLKAGNGISLQRNGYEYTVSSKVANVVAGENVNIQEGTESDGSPRFEISAVDTVPDVDKAYVDSKIAAIVDKDTVTTLAAGNANVTVVDSGVGDNHAYTISTVDTKPDVTKAYVDEQIASVPRPDVTKAYVDEQIAALEDKDTKTTMVAGNQNVTISDSGVGGNHVYSVSTKDTVTTVKAGDNISVTKNGNEYTVTATGGSSDTVTTLEAGTGISITDSGTDGNHNYTVKGAKATITSLGSVPLLNAVNSDGTGWRIKPGNNINFELSAVGESLPNCTISATDTKTTLTAGNGISITDSGTDGNHIYTVKGAQASTPSYSGRIAGKITNFDGTAWQIVAGENVNFTADAVGEYITNLKVNATNTVTTLTAGNGISISDSGTGGNHNYTVTNDYANNTYVEVSSLSGPVNKIEFQIYSALGVVADTLVHTSFENDQIKPYLAVNGYDNANLYCTLHLGSSKTIENISIQARYLQAEISVPLFNGIIIRDLIAVPLNLSYGGFGRGAYNTYFGLVINDIMLPAPTCRMRADNRNNRLLFVMRFVDSNIIDFTNWYSGSFYLTIPRSLVDIDNQ